MRQGYRVIDVDTHVTPSIEHLMLYADAELRERREELTPHIRVTKPTPGRGHPTEPYGVVRVNPYPYNRVAATRPAKSPRPAVPAPAAPSRAGSRTWPPNHDLSQKS